MIKVGLIGYGKAGKAVAQVLSATPGIALRWVAKRQPSPGNTEVLTPEGVPLITLTAGALESALASHPVDALVDFSSAEALQTYGEVVRHRQLTLVSAISAYSDEDVRYLQDLGRSARVMSSPNITLGINFLILAARLLRSIAPFADVEIIEQHFREKPEISGTARKIAASLDVTEDRITSLRLGGIVGQHEVVFGFPHQTVRLTHDSIRREAFGTGAAFALKELVLRPVGFYSFDDILMDKIRQGLLAR